MWETTLVLHVRVMDQWFHYTLLLGISVVVVLISDKINIAQDAPQLSVLLTIIIIIFKVRFLKFKKVSSEDSNFIPK